MANNSVLAILVILACLISIAGGSVLGYTLHPETKTVVETVSVPGPERIVTQNVTETITVDTVLSDKLDNAVKAFLEEFEDNDDTPTGFDFDQLSKKTVDRDYSIEVTKDTETVNFSITLKFVDSDTKEKVYEDYNVSVVFEDDEDPVVDY